MENVRDSHLESGQGDLSSPPPDTGIITYQYSNLNLSWIQPGNFHPYQIDNIRQPDDQAIHLSSSLLTAQLLEQRGDTYSAAELSDSCSSWLSFINSEFLEETNNTNKLPDRASENTNASEAPKRTPRNRLRPDAVRILKSWFQEHHDDPYPSEREKDDLARQTGLSVTQISNWFNNARRSKSRSKLTQREGRGNGNSLLSPLERWKNSPPETEAAATADIMRALEEQPYISNNTATRSLAPYGCSSNSSSASSFIPMAPSVSSLERSQSSGSELNFNRSQPRYQRPPTPIPGKRSRRRRNLVRSLRKQRDKERRAYQCTFCADSFLTKYDWQRHEKALHLPVDRWVCSPHGGVVELDNIHVCAFCHSPETSPEHFASHNLLACHMRPFDERIFFRKDHLKQHLKLTHNVGWLPSMEQWRATQNEITSRCGFCGRTFSAWDERVEHVAEHFKSGADIIQWKGDWGFDPDIQKQVQNAMPPYLLGYERNTMDPWRITDVPGNNESLLDGSIPNALSKYSNLQRDLVAYIRNQLAANIYPSDLELQDMARLIAYGNNDRLDQTYADDPAWLEMIKREAGLEHRPEHECAAQQLFAP
ncbi:hypothetical protein Asppvi_010247 [Aspergillus pseudoviridinutans]|uniref:Homeobox and C2H2 transcription factor n=1 Tax=Aspergillus pseudoviridinutans TaxID=1517512 RepID=A0A9P3EZ91_9EURO|nr:uncharacterized protein Asppvi_010247 [Aspergillus pseudoviridinutans]GIJ91282.1 hypothetical protein Asppvi_010247 [Aspergillus pseudoviridinutans]